MKQEGIPVGYVPSAAVAAVSPGMSAQGVSVQGVCYTPKVHAGIHPPMHAGIHPPL